MVLFLAHVQDFLGDGLRESASSIVKELIPGASTAAPRQVLGRATRSTYGSRKENCKVREWSLITVSEGYKTEGGGRGQVKFYPYKKVGRKRF